MQPFERLCPAPPRWQLDWDQVSAAFDWVRDLAGVPQDPHHHAEGDVAVHTRLACQALADMPQWRARPAGERVRLFTAVLMHDIGKPGCTRVDPDGRITSHGHSVRGDLMVRRILWELGADIAWREHVAALVRHHQFPFWALARPDAQQIAFRASLLACNADLADLATADATGRICADNDVTMEHVELYREYCAEQRCLDRPRAFASDHARFQYFRTPGRDPDYAAYDDTRLTVTVMSGLPGAGKDSWITEHRPDLPVVSLDVLRSQLRIPATADQRPVAAAAYEAARQHLRAGRSFVWNATNVSRRTRQQCIGLVADYHGRVELVALEAPPDVLGLRNQARADPVPHAVIDRLVRRWELPDPTEAHSVTWCRTA